MIVLRSASTPPLELLSKASLPPYISTKLFGDTSLHTDFRISDWNKSSSAQLFLVQCEETGRQFVIKMLCPYRDTRYSLEALDKRQQCLLEALRRNRVFNPDLYLGLAPLIHLDLAQKAISIGEVLEYPMQKLLDVDTEYVLLMKPLDQENRLDYLLGRKVVDSLMPLTIYISDIHNFKVSDISKEESIFWGSYDYLVRKLEHNLELLDFLINRCNESNWEDRKELAMRILGVQKKTQELIVEECYQQYFQLRVDGKYIKLCHGDIKSPHIWTVSNCSDGKQAWSFNILDAIDFNNKYNHIDILSDFAMLIADVQARTQSPLLVNEMIASYLRKTNQDNEVARTVLNYYVIEKAIVGTSISILYDDEPQLGRAFLQVAENRLE